MPIEKIVTIASRNLVVLIASPFNQVAVSERIDTGRQQLFSGIPLLRETFEAFEASFTDDTTYEDAINFFTPIMGNYVVNS